MRTTEVIPGLILSDEDYKLAAAGIAEHAPDLGPLTAEQFLNSARWLNIPDLDGKISKSELTLLNSVERTIKVNLWFRPDVRGGVEEQIPHNHRWDVFHGHLLRGGYTETRYHRRNIDADTGHAEVVIEPGVTHTSPEANAVEHGVYHEVMDVLEPGTMSLMVCGHGKFGDWGHLDIATGKTRKDQPVANFNAMFNALNPHKQ